MFFELGALCPAVNCHYPDTRRSLPSNPVLSGAKSRYRLFSGINQTRSLACSKQPWILGADRRAARIVHSLGLHGKHERYRH